MKEIISYHVELFYWEKKFLIKSVLIHHRILYKEDKTIPQESI